MIFENNCITIGLPTYNTPKPFFDLCLNQILRQTFSNFILLIVDDGSDVDFTDYLKKIQNLDHRIKIIFKEKNTGIYDTRNIILANIETPFFTFIDSDDYIPIDYLERMISQYKTSNCFETMVCCGYVKFKGNIPKINLSNKNNIFDDCIMEKALNGDFGHSVWGKLVPSELLNGLVIDSKNGFDDAQLVPALCERVKKIIFTETTIYYYRQMSGSIMHSNNYTLFQAYRTYSNYLAIAKKLCNNCVPRLENMVAMARLKLCCVDYNDDFSKSELMNASNTLKKSIKDNGYIASRGDNFQMFLAAHFPRLFCYTYCKKRKRTTKIKNCT